VNIDPGDINGAATREFSSSNKMAGFGTSMRKRKMATLHGLLQRLVQKEQHPNVHF
jgi:hypothetical protein